MLMRPHNKLHANATYGSPNATDYNFRFVHSLGCALLGYWIVDDFLNCSCVIAGLTPDGQIVPYDETAIQYWRKSCVICDMPKYGTTWYAYRAGLADVGYLPLNCVIWKVCLNHHEQKVAVYYWDRAQ